VNAGQAESLLAAIPLGLRTGANPDQTTLQFAVVPLQEQMVGDVRPMLFLLLASVGVLLLIAVANVANLQIARAAARGREIATRLSIGAGRWQIARQQLVESLIVSLSGGALGVLIATAGVNVLLWIGPRNVPRLDEIRVDTNVLLFGLVVSIMAGVLFGLAPAWGASKQNLMGSLNEGGRAGMQGRGRSRLRMGLAVAQIGLSFMLLIGAGLLIRSFAALQQVEMGIESSDLLTVQISPAGNRYQDDTATRTFYRQLMEGVRSIPGVQAAALSSTIPPGQGGFAENITIEGSNDVNNPVLLLPVVSPEYFRTMSIRLLAGRYFADADSAESSRVTIVSDTMARRYFPNQNPVGKRIKIGGRERPNAPWLEIVGVVGDVRYRAREADIEPVFYVPHTQNTVRSMHLVMRSSQPPASLRSALRRQIAS
jgi:predicted permease